MSPSGTFPLTGPRRDRGRPDEDGRRGAAKRQRGSARRRWSPVPLLTAALEAMMVMGIVAFVMVFRRGTHPFAAVAPTCLAIAALTVGIGFLRQDYALAVLAARRGQVERAMGAWSIAFGIAMVIDTATGVLSLEIRGATGLLFVGGLVSLPLARIILSRALHARGAFEAISTRRVMIVTSERDGAAMGSGIPDGWAGRTIGTLVLRDDPSTRFEDLALTVAVARMKAPDDIVLLLPWEDHKRLEDTVAALRQLPVGLHLGAPAALFGTVGLGGLELTRRPLSPIDLRMKRLFDIVMASAALVVLSPVLVLVALAIRLDSRGPILFVQRRYGFNQRPFRIIKFRSMTVMEDGATLRQVTDGDRRVTRVGGVLRRTSLDELPQLFNVLKGDMSLVGPRPHALAHDQQFERMVALYGRRHNVRPGITGWAQVSGFRGEIDTPDKIEGRVRHDLDYIDNWSIWFDLSILVRTVFSRRAFRNAK